MRKNALIERFEILYFETKSTLRCGEFLEKCVFPLFDLMKKKNGGRKFYENPARCTEKIFLFEEKKSAGSQPRHIQYERKKVYYIGTSISSKLRYYKSRKHLLTREREGKR